MYLVGSVHMLTQDFYPLSKALDDAFKESDLLVEEADLAELLAPQAQLLMLSRGMLPSNQIARQGDLAGDLRRRHQASRRARPADRAAETLQAVGARADA